MIPPQQASQLMLKPALLHTKMVTAILMSMLGIVTAVFIVVGHLEFDQGVLKNKPDLCMILNVAGMVLWLVLMLAGYVAPDFLFGSTEKRTDLPLGGDDDVLHQAIDALDGDTKENLFATYFSRVMTRFALFEGAGVFNAAIYFLNGNMVNLLLVVATLLVMAFMFPTLARFRHWLESIR